MTSSTQEWYHEQSGPPGVNFTLPPDSSSISHLRTCLCRSADRGSCSWQWWLSILCWEGGREGGREGGKEGRREKGREGGREGDKGAGSRREGKREEGGKEGGKEGGRKGGEGPGSLAQVVVEFFKSLVDGFRYLLSLSSLNLSTAL